LRETLLRSPLSFVGDIVGAAGERIHRSEVMAHRPR
jgi:hypothetical protein